MPRARLFLVPAGLACGLLGCARPPPPAPPVSASAAPSPWASIGIDGRYGPAPGGVRGSPACGRSRFEARIRVRDGTVSMQPPAGPFLTGRVAPDGSVLIESGQNTLRGAFGFNEFSGSFTRRRCKFILGYRKE